MTTKYKNNIPIILQKATLDETHRIFMHMMSGNHNDICSNVLTEKVI